MKQLLVAAVLYAIALAACTNNWYIVVTPGPVQVGGASGTSQTLSGPYSSKADCERHLNAAIAPVVNPAQLKCERR